MEKFLKSEEIVELFRMCCARAHECSGSMPLDGSKRR